MTLTADLEARPAHLREVLEIYSEEQERLRQMVADMYGLSDEQLLQHRETVDRFIEETGLSLHEDAEISVLRASLGFAPAFQTYREMTFLDRDDDDHVSDTGCRGMHIFTPYVPRSRQAS